MSETESLPIEIQVKKHAKFVVKNIGDAVQLIQTLIEERENLLAQYQERAYAMQETGQMVRSIYTPQVKLLKEIIRELWLGNFERAKELEESFKKQFHWTGDV